MWEIDTPKFLEKQEHFGEYYGYFSLKKKNFASYCLKMVLDGSSYTDALYFNEF